jgi:hypothetical protein
MFKRVGIAAFVLLAAFLGGLIFYNRPAREPSYKGRPLHYWVDPWSQGGQESPEEVKAALQAMSGPAIPYLMERLRWRPKPIILKLQNEFPKVPFFTMYAQGASNPRGPAAHALGQFGPLASNAIPPLVALSSNYDLPSAWYDRGCAQAALIKIRREPLSPYIEKLKDTSDFMAWYQNALMIGEFGVDGAEAIPNLISALDPTNNGIIQAHALIALGMIHSQPEVCVPAIAPFLRSPDVALRQKAIYALPQFHKAAKPAWTNLLATLNDPDPWTRLQAPLALKQIDPEAAAKAGIR